MDTGLLSTLQVSIAATFYPPPGILDIIKSDGTYGTCRISCLARFRAGSILAQQAAGSLFMEV